MKDGGTILVILLLNHIYRGQSLVCLNCDNVFHPHTCKHVTECFKDEECGTQTYISNDGEVKYKLGCVDKNTCSQYSYTSPPPDVHGFQSCRQCCAAGNLCNAARCNSTGYPRQRGPICYSCENSPAGVPCHKIEFCEAHEVCYNEATLEFQSDTLYSSGCRSKHNCVITQPAVGKRDVDFTSHEVDSGSRDVDVKSHDFASRSVSVCTDCCSGDLCNTNCQKRDTCADDSTCQLLMQNYDVCRTPDVAKQFCKKSCNLCGDHHICNDTTRNCSYQDNLVRNMCSSFQSASDNGCLKYCGYCSTTTPYWTKPWTDSPTTYHGTWSTPTTTRPWSDRTTRTTTYVWTDTTPSPWPASSWPFSKTSYAPAMYSLAIGDRVVRGPDWKWGNQDHNGVGTIIGNSTTPGWVSVKWDYDGSTDSYRMGAENATDLKLYTGTYSTSATTTQSTTAKGGRTVFIGETVCRGPDWKWGDQDHGGPGTVTALDTTPGWVRVRWSGDSTNVYRDGADGARDLIACSNTTTTTKKITTTTTSASTTQTDFTSPVPTDGPELAALLHTGSRVVRGKDWKWDNQDHLGKGTVTNVGTDGWVTVKWDNDGATNTYRMGAEGAYDLMLAA